MKIVYEGMNGVGCEQKVYEFDNGYGASVITGSFSYGGNKGLYELAVLKNGKLCYDTPITSDVIGYLTQNEVDDLLKKIEKLPKIF